MNFGKLIIALVHFACLISYNQATSQSTSLTVTIGHSDPFEACFSPDGRALLTASSDGTTKLWDCETGLLIRTVDQNIMYSSGSANVALAKCPQFSSNGKLMASMTLMIHHHDYILSAYVKIFDAETGKLIKRISTNEAQDGVSYGERREFFDSFGFDFSADGQYLITFTPNRVVWDIRSGKEVKKFNDWGRGPITNYSESKKWIVHADFESYSFRSKVAPWSLIDLPFGSGWKTSRNVGVRSFTSPSIGGKSDNLLLYSDSVNSYLVDLSTKKKMAEFTLASVPLHNEVSQDGQLVAVFSDSVTKIWNTGSMKLLARIIDPKPSFFFSGSSLNELGMQKVFLSPDGKYISVYYKVFDTEGGRFIYELPEIKRVQYTSGIAYEPIPLLFSPTSKYFLRGSSLHNTSDGTFKCELETGNVRAIKSAKFLKNGRIKINEKVYSDAGLFPSIDAMVDQEPFDFVDSINSKWYPFKNKPRDINYETVIGNGKYSSDGKYLITESADEKITIWDTRLKQEVREFDIGKLIDINSKSFNALFLSGGQLKLVNLLSGEERLTFSLMTNFNLIVTHKSGLFDGPQDLQNALRFIQNNSIVDLSQLKARYYEPGLWKKVMSGEKLREVAGMKSIDLAPDIQVGQVDENGYLPIELTNRGGGIGEVSISIFGKEIVKDAREKNADPNAQSLKLKYYVGNHKNLIKGENIIAVKAWNKDHWVESRGAIVNYTKGEKENYQPAVHILTCGVSDYTGNEIDLKYAAKDAEDVSKALKLGASKLFGTDRSYVYDLTTNQDKDHWPTKKNILKAFEKISTTAHPLDVVVVYLSGHGINVGGTDGDWHYLAQEAYSASAAAYSDPAIVEQTTISSNDLVELFKKIPAAKQVLMIDACASGKVVENLMAQKDIPSSTLRALDRMKDRTGMHIITGCTADAVSYEASRYGQGVLTYSLLEGIRGAALREDQFIDVNKLFQYAQDRVPTLASGIGGIQTPMVFSPNGSQSFDVGQLSEEEKKSVPIAKIRPVYIRSNFQDENELEDVLNLGKKVDDLLNETAAKGTDAPLIFVDVREYPEGCKLNGLYKKDNGKVTLKLKKRCEGKEETMTLSGVDGDELSEQIIKSLNK